MGKHRYRKQPLLYIQQPDTDVPPAYMQHDYATPKKQVNKEPVTKEKVGQRSTRPLRRWQATTNTEEEMHETEHPVKQEEKPFQALSVPEKVDYFVRRVGRGPAIKCEVQTEHKNFRGIIKDFQEHTVWMQLENRTSTRDIPLNDITHIRMLGF